VVAEFDKQRLGCHKYSVMCLCTTVNMLSS